MTETSAQPSVRRNLYPPIEPFVTGFLDVGDGQSMYWEVSGNPDGKPVVFLHGGPGGGAQPAVRQFFDPAAYRIVLLDQRGCGRSTPHVADGADLSVNTTDKLLGDIEALREHLSIDKWMVFGGSWGSTLSIAYAEAFPTRVTELVLRGIFLLRRSEIDWYYNGGAGNIFPERWDKFLEPVPEAQRGEDLVAVYHQLLHSEDPTSRPAQPSPGLRGKDRQATCTHRPTRSNRTPRPGSPWPSPASRTTTSSTAGSSTRTNSYAKVPHCRAFRGRSSRAATTSSARPPAPGRCTRRGPNPSS